MNFVSKLFTSVLFWLIVGAIVAGVMVYRYFTKGVSPLVVDYDKGNLTQSIDHYQTVADSLYSTMDGWGTDVFLINSLLSDLNSDEVKAVYSFFGMREYDQNFSPFAEKPKLDLVDWFKLELSGSDLLYVERVFSSVWH